MLADMGISLPALPALVVAGSLSLDNSRRA